MKLKPLLIAAAVAALVAPAFAAPIAGPGIGTQSSTIADAPNVPSNFGGIVGVGSFLDTFSFSTDIGGTLSVSLNTNTQPFTGTPAQISFFQTIFGANNALEITRLGGVVLGYGGFPAGNVTTNFTLPSAGSYSMQISGVGTGAFGGAYNGSLIMTAVPEPESYAMFLAGLGLMGFMARRRSTSV